MKRYEYFEHTADTGIRAFGDTPAKALENAALGMLAVIYDTGSVKPEKLLKIELRREEEADLIIAFLSELLYNFSVGKFMCCGVSVETLTETRIIAYASGEIYDPGRHKIKGEIKTVTYHRFEFKKNGSCMLQVICDV